LANPQKEPEIVERMEEMIRPYSSHPPSDDEAEEEERKIVENNENLLVQDALISASRTFRTVRQVMLGKDEKKPIEKLLA